MTQSLLDLLGAEDEREFEKNWAAALKVKQSPSAQDEVPRARCSRRPHVERRCERARVSVTGRESMRNNATATPIRRWSQQSHEPSVTCAHVANAVAKSLSSKLYGAHHLRQQAAIAAQRQQALDAANASAEDLLNSQKQLVNRAAELRREMATVQTDEDAAVVRLKHESGRLDTDLGRVHLMELGLEHLLQSQTAKLEDAMSSVARAEAARPQPLLGNSASPQGDTTLSAPVQVAGSADAWSVQLAVQDMVDAVADEEEAQRAAERHSRCESRIQHAKVELQQLQERLADERRKPRKSIDYDTCARLRNDITAVRDRLDQDQRRSTPGHARAMEKIGAVDDSEESSWCRPQRRLVALLDGSFGLPVDDPAMVDALTPFDEIGHVPNPFESKITVRKGPSVQHLLFGETYSARWETVKSMVWGLVECAIETRAVHKPLQFARPAIWEWRDSAGRRAWHQFDSSLSQRLEERYIQLGSERGEQQDEVPAEHLGPAEIRWTEPAEEGAAFVIDLERMVQYPDRDIPMNDASDDAVDALPCALLVRQLVAPQPILLTGKARGRQRVLHPLVRAIAREIRRRDQALPGNRREGHTASGTVTTKSLPCSSDLTTRPKVREARSAEEIENAAVEAMMANAERLGRRDRALPVGTRLWVENVGYCRYESIKTSGVSKQGPATHHVRVFPGSDNGSRFSRVKPTAGQLHKIHLVGPDAPAWSIEPPDLGSDPATRNHSGRLDASITGGRKWHSHETSFGLGYTRYEFSRFQSRQEQVGTREIITEPRFWMDTTAYFAVEELPQVAAGGGDSAAS